MISLKNRGGSMRTGIVRSMRSFWSRSIAAASSLTHFPKSHVLYFLHIPKTSGTTFDYMLRNKFRSVAVTPITCDMISFYKLAEKNYRKFDYVSGHLNFGYCLDKLVFRPIRTVTLLREPRSLLLSIYKHISEYPNYSLHQHMMQNCSTLDLFFHDPVISSHIENWQTRFLASHERRVTPEQIVIMRSLKPDDARHFLTNLSSDVDKKRDSLSEAVNRLRQCEVVGLSEKLLDSANLVARMEGWNPFNSVPHLNESSNKIRVADLPMSILRRIDQLSILDRQLYDIGCSLFKQRLNACDTPAQKQKNNHTLANAA